MNETHTTTLQKLGDTLWAIDQEFVRSFLIVGENKALLLDTGGEPCDLMGLIRSVTDQEIVLVHELYSMRKLISIKSERI